MRPTPDPIADDAAAPPREPVAFHRHDLGDAELAAIAEVFRGPILTTGALVERFEARFAETLGRKHALAVTSCTGALHMSLLALGIGPGDEVITTPMTFVATASAIIEVGATPVFVDVEPDTGNLDAARVEAAITPRTRAVMPVHLYGLMCDMTALRAIADRHGLALIEDAAHCIEGVRGGMRPGEASATACFSFYATKNLTCGEGGALVTDDTALYEKLKLIRLHGIDRSLLSRHTSARGDWDMVAMGWKYNMSNIEAAILLPQLDRLADNLERRRALAARYRALLADLPGVHLPANRPDSVHARHLFPIWVEDERDDLVAWLRGAGIGCVVNYRPVHLTQYFRDAHGYREGMFPQAERIGARTLSLPFYPGMPESHVDRVVATLRASQGRPRTVC
ncbi:DegT/DnrJ/EryC1/StrS aminotransferase family protein [Roseomonas genomospecies 6]|uniref:DegT/DnrJ/EryC1/StrS family aminotransferase n=1 Tax=Roseomonas genomospecies 6 TaxID=214106 RepID=A0A9W7KNG9_9PROT|nr:DegT/DnrJ/EryC1/StrS family aminotransferase [Roseomonas genomospecies 6]KAA0676213.1 DegT/DnrJ/EryC1/StrS family aminotransferase [Roseomonas genomospecies 6]